MLYLRLPHVQHYLCGDVSDDEYDDDDKYSCRLVFECLCNICIFVVLVPFEIGMGLRCWYRRKQAQRRFCMQVRERRNALHGIQPLPRKRNRHLSISSLEREGSFLSTTAMKIRHRLRGRKRKLELQQSQSPFFKLSAELRLMIYFEVLGGYRFGVCTILPPVNCLSHIKYKSLPCIKSDGSCKPPVDIRRGSDRDPISSDERLLPLLQTCHKV